MMTTVGQIEKLSQARVVALFRERLCYDYLGHLVSRDWLQHATSAQVPQ
jgi:type I restriction enzyme, R subunit